MTKDKSATTVTAGAKVGVGSKLGGAGTTAADKTAAATKTGVSVPKLGATAKSPPKLGAMAKKGNLADALDGFDNDDSEEDLISNVGRNNILKKPATDTKSKLTIPDLTKSKLGGGAGTTAPLTKVLSARDKIADCDIETTELLNKICTYLEVH